MSMSNTGKAVKDIRGMPRCEIYAQRRGWVVLDGLGRIALLVFVQFFLADELFAAKTLLWGDTHVHSSNSGDSFLFGNLSADPDTAYRFARGLPVIHPGHGGRVQIGTPLDFLVIADHAEYLGVPRYIYEKGVPREELSVLEKFYVPFVEWYYRRSMNSGGSGPGFQGVLSENHDVRADAAVPMKDTIPGSQTMMRSTWSEINATAEAHNEPGEFTTLIGWEWTSNAAGANLHRVVFTHAGANVANSFYPYSSMDSKYPEDLWAWLEKTSQDTGADFVAIPHNSNISKGYMFPGTKRLRGSGIDAVWAKTRARWEPVVEVTQTKGNSETHPSQSPEDSFADFEEYPHYIQRNSPPYDPQPGDFIRPALKAGLLIKKDTGSNPYAFGLIGSTDSHTGLASAEEPNFWGKFARHVLPQRTAELAREGRPVTAWSMSASGLAAVWAEENTREAIFAAFKRREVYGTTGPRISIRVSAGTDIHPQDLELLDFSGLSQRGNVPMGGELKALKTPPAFLIHAMKDPESAHLDRVQVVKGWVADGGIHERVYDVVWSGDRVMDEQGQINSVPDTVDIETATYSNTYGAASLAVVWTDPEFDGEQAAFYYVRVLEVPTPRHSLFDAVALGIEPELTGRPYSIQERAYTSPIFYSP
jgi:hypothetical protein